MIPLFLPKHIRQLKKRLNESIQERQSDTNGPYKVQIYSTSSDFKSASYLKKALSRFRQISSNDIYINPKNLNEKFSFYFAIVPEEIENICDVSREIERIIKRSPSCHIFLVHTHGSSRMNSSTLANLARKRSNYDIRDIDFCPSLPEFLTIRSALLRATQPPGKITMPKDLTASSYVSKIMTPNDRLITVSSDAKFSEVFFKVNGLGISHIPVLKSETERCIKILSRRDLVKRLPPTRIPEDVATTAGINRGKLVRMVAELGNKTIEELFPKEQKIEFVVPSTIIGDVIDRLTTKYYIGEFERYISGLPVYVDEETAELEGFVSFRDVIKHFISTQTEFLKLKVKDIAKLPTDYEEIIRMTNSDNLSYADSLFQTGMRSLPIVEGDYDSQVLWGFVDEIKANTYNHAAFTNQLATLSCDYFATKVEALRVLHPNETLSECLSVFYVREEGQSPPASFVVAEDALNASGQPYKKLKGILSYIDVLKAWKKWNAKK